MFNAISKWVEYDRTSRTSMASRLLPAVQFSRCSLAFLSRIRDDILVKQHLSVQSSVEEAIKRFGSEVLFVLGGSNAILETLNLSKSSWTQHRNISNGPLGRTHGFTAGQKILVLEEDNKRFRSFHTLTKVWNDLRPLPVFRDWMSAAIEGNELFVMGGLKHESRCDVYDTHLDSWTKVASLNVGRRWFASSSLEGKIYSCGGKGSFDEFLSSMEVFDSKEKSRGWTLMTSLSVGRSGHCLVSCGQYLWAVGGYDGLNPLAVLEKFDLSTNSWTKVASMSSGKFDLTASFMGGRLYAVGGWNSGEQNTVEVYDPGENSWTTGASLSRGRSFHASSVVLRQSKHRRETTTNESFA